MSDDYAVIAPLYEPLGMAAFAEAITPRVIDFAHAHDWVGRRVVDIGCGTGASVRWLANRSYNITGIDRSTAMLHVAQASMSGGGVAYQLLEGDARALDDLHDIDLVLALDMINEQNNLRDLEAVFTSAAKALSPGKLFIFDLHTIEGLITRSSTGATISEDDALTVFVTRQFDYERQAASDGYIVFRRGDEGWQRSHAQRTLRGFPVQVVSALLQRAGFGIMALTNTRLEAVDPSSIHEPRVVVFAQRSAAETD